MTNSDIIRILDGISSLSPSPSPVSLHRDVNYRNVKIQINYYAIVFVVFGIIFLILLGFVVYSHFSSYEWRDGNQYKASWLREYVVEELESHFFINGEIEKSVECQCSDDWNLTDATKVIQVRTVPWEKVAANDEFHKKCTSSVFLE